MQGRSSNPSKHRAKSGSDPAPAAKHSRPRFPKQHYVGAMHVRHPLQRYNHSLLMMRCCSACGSILRSLERLGQAIPEQCKLCFERHCWDGKLATGTPPFVAPPLLLSPSTTFAEWNATTWQPAFSETGTASNASTTPSSGSHNAAGERIICPPVLFLLLGTVAAIVFCF
jgi:hypothetical protein